MAKTSGGVIGGMAAKNRQRRVKMAAKMAAAALASKAAASMAMALIAYR